MQRWMNAAIAYSKHSKLVGTENNQPNSSTVPAKVPKKALSAAKEGYLDKLAGGVSGRMATLTKGVLQWRTRWFVLKDGVLFKYKTKVRIPNLFLLFEL